MLKRKVLEAIKEFNEFRSPEVTAELVSIENNRITVRMSGTYCKTCDLYDYFEDLLWKFKDFLGVKVSIISTSKIGHFSYEITYEMKFS